MADYGIAQGFAQATGKLPGLALNLAQLQQQGQHMRALEADSQQRLALDTRRVAIAEKTGLLQQENLQVQNRKAKMEADALADSMKLLPVNETLMKMGITRPAEQKLFLEYAGPHVETGEASGQPVIQKQHAKAIWEKMRGDVDFGIKLGTTRGAEINKEIAALQGQLTNPETSGKIKPEQAQQIQAQIDKLVEQRTMADNGVKMLKQKQRAANKENIQTMRDASGNWVEVNTVTGEQTPLPAGMVPEKIAVEQIKAGGKSPVIKSVDRGDVVDIYENGVKVRTERKGVTPNSGNTQDRSDRTYAVTLRKEFNNLPEVKEYNQTIPKIKSMQAAFNESKKTKNFVAVDQALITLFNKLTDPNSVVRESEYARTAENIPMLNQIKGKVEKVMKGGAGLTADERASLMKMATLMQKGYDDIRGRRIKEYRGYGAQAGLKNGWLEDSTSGSVSGDNPYSAMSNEDLLRELGK